MKKSLGASLVHSLSELDAIEKKKQPFFLRRNYIEFGYRADLKRKGMTFKQCTESLFSYLHNESGNVFSALVPAIYFTLQMVQGLLGQGEYYSGLKTLQSRLFLFIAAFSCVFDTWTSFAYHLYNPMGKSQC